MKKRSRRKENDHLADQQLECQSKRTIWVPIAILIIIVSIGITGLSLLEKSDNRKIAERKKVFMARIQSGDCKQLYKESLEDAANMLWQSSAAKGVLYQNCRDLEKRQNR